MTPRRIDMDDPEADATGPDGLMYYRGELFTGEMVELYDDGTLFTLTTYVDGMEDGPSQGFYADGTPNPTGGPRGTGRSASGASGTPTAPSSRSTSTTTPADCALGESGTPRAR